MTSARAQTTIEHQYGADPRQALDIYQIDGSTDVPVIVILHGGAFHFGDKRNPDVWQAKVNHLCPWGYIFISVNTHLILDANPVEQTEDLARAVGFVQRNATNWGGNPDMIVLMGHSSGAHASALLTTQQDFAVCANLRPWLGTILLDISTLDLPKRMNEFLLFFKRKAFRTDLEFVKRASLTEFLSVDDNPILVGCSSKRKRSCWVATAFAELSNNIAVLLIKLSHVKVISQLGVNSHFIDSVDPRFVRKLSDALELV